MSGLPKAETHKRPGRLAGNQDACASRLQTAISPFSNTGLVDYLSSSSFPFSHPFSPLLRRRLLSAGILIGTVLAIIYLDAKHPLWNSPGLWLVPVLYFFAIGTAWEFAHLAKRQVAFSAGVATLLTFVAVSVSTIPVFAVAVTGESYPAACPVGIPGWIGLGLVLACGLAGIATLRSFALQQTQTLERWAMLTLIPVYAGGLSSLWVPIRLHGEPWQALLNLVGIVAVTKITDAAAYFTGRGLGRNKLCPSISPGKTIEGSIGGLLSGVVASILYFQFLMPMWLSSPTAVPVWWGPALLGLLLGIVAMIGDLIESMVKRAVGEKDSGRLLPGLGGIWDVTDSLLPTAAVGYLGLIAKWI